MGYSFCISTPRPPPGDRHSIHRAQGFQFHPGPCIQFSGDFRIIGEERSATPSGPDNVPGQKRQSDPGPLRSRPPKGGDRSPVSCWHTGRDTGECRRLRKPETGASQPSQGPSGQRTGTGARGGPSFHPSRIAIRSTEAGFVESPRPALRSPDCHPPPLIFASGEWDGGNLDVPRPPETLGVRCRWQEQPHRRRHEHWRWV